MITSFNPENKVQFEMYSHLFKKAYNDLLEKGKLTEEEIKLGRFTSLDNYFAHMADLFAINPVYMMLPLDPTTEGVFEINANTRAVAIPAQFGKCAAVQSDSLCEIAMFSIDRYFDYQDLAETLICVQWVNAAGEEGVSHIQLIDLETFPEKIRFGWPLTSDITKTPGQVQFSIRFYKEKIAVDNNGDIIYDENGKEKKIYSYLLNTLANIITVRESLTVDNPVIEEHNTVDLFRHFISNSQNPSYPIPAPIFFSFPGQDLPGYGAIDLDTNTLTLTAQAVANDLGDIQYEWMYVPAGSEIAQTLNDKDGYKISTVWEAVNPESREGSQKYYIKTNDSDGIQIGYELYTGVIPAEDGVELFICKTSLEIEDTENEVVGTYYVNATNTVSVNTSNPSPSTKCVVPEPQDIAFTEKGDLKTHVFITDGRAELKPVLVTDPTTPAYTYKWKSDTSWEVGDKVPETADELTETAAGVSNEINYSAIDPGWYALSINAKLNRKEKNKDTTVCKVTNLPTAPIIESLQYSKLKFDDSGNAIDPGENWNPVSVDTPMPETFKYGDIIRLRVNTDLDELNPLFTEGLTYQWQVHTPDASDFKNLTEEYRGLNSIVHENSPLDQKYIDIRCVADTMVYSYNCKITNTIQTEKKTTNSSDYASFVIS